MKLTAPALLAAVVLLSFPAAAGAAGTSPTEDVPVRGGIAALSGVIPLSPAPDRARFMSEAIRVVYSWPQTGPYANEPMRRRIATFLASGTTSDTVDDVPVPLPAAIWGDAVFHRAIRPGDLVGAILADRSAALVCYALAALDDETLQFVADRRSLLSRLVERAPATFAAFGESLHVRNGRLAVPGGEAAAPLWESIVGEKLDRSDRFIQLLFETDRGRLAYLFDILTHVDAPTVELVIGQNGDGLKRLAALARRAFPEWDATMAPFVRPPTDLNAFFARLRAATGMDGGGASRRTTAFWLRVFGDSPGTIDTATDLAWLADTIVGHPSREREQRLDLFSFVERVFGTAADEDAVAAAHGFGSYAVLMLTLERIGVRAPSTYVAARQQADTLTALDATRGTIALAQFQGAVALIARLAAVRSIDSARAETLARDLCALHLDTSGYYSGAIATFIADRIVPLLPRADANATIDDVILAGAAGPQTGASGARVEWEGQRYRVDPGGAELVRLRRARDRQEGVTFEAALGVAAIMRRLNTATAIDVVPSAATTLDAAARELSVARRRDDEQTIRVLRETSRTLAALTRAGDLAGARRAAGPLVPVADALLGHALLSLAYACDLGDPDGTVLIAGDPSRRHDFGYDLPGRQARIKAVWGIASVEMRKGPWHLVGSALALDLAMAPLALRRITVDRVPESPMLNLMQRDAFAASVAVMNTGALTDADRDRIAAYISDGRLRIMRAVEGGESPESIGRALDLDGWRARALSWTAARDPEHTASLFSLTELLVLGGGAPAAFHSWGTYALRTAGCVCARLSGPGEWRRWWGLTQAGLPAILVADLGLNVAVVLHNLQMPAVLAKPVLAAAMQDFVDGTNPTDGNDWLTLSRAAQAIDRTRFEDYVAAATADGPLLPDADTGDR